MISTIMRAFQYQYNPELFFALSALTVWLLACAGLYLWQNRRRTSTFGFFSLYTEKPLLSEWERKALKQFQCQIPDTYYLCPQVRIADFVRISGATPALRQKALYKISSKSVDFLVIDAATGRVCLAIELDDKTHARADRRHRDALVSELFSHLKIPLRRFRPFEPLILTPKDLAAKSF